MSLMGKLNVHKIEATLNMYINHADYGKGLRQVSFTYVDTRLLGQSTQRTN